MAAPNMAAPTTVKGKNTAVALTTTSEFSVLSNAASSGKLLRITGLIVANVHASLDATIILKRYTAAALGGTGHVFAQQITVPVNSILVVIDKNTAFYLEEDMSVGATADAANKITVHCSYEDVS